MQQLAGPDAPRAAGQKALTLLDLQLSEMRRAADELFFFHEAMPYADKYFPGPPYCTYGLRLPAAGVLYVPEAQGTLRVPASGVRAVRSYRCTTGSTSTPKPNQALPRSCAPAYDVRAAIDVLGRGTYSQLRVGLGLGWGAAPTRSLG